MRTLDVLQTGRSSGAERMPPRNGTLFIAKDYSVDYANFGRATNRALLGIGADAATEWYPVYSKGLFGA
ncbi:hypothetical protein [Dyadobacter sediminis]|uniref:Uncharacterized protein n=1 Tax=Dyadobacter sediminis TaxID=1493691 RepID=A0A5R9KDM4_9BACT|nr:hypothetical protein [Dyadobacter sediminis]TLU94234.1 hypothetical protein FEM55_08230 [Dyadobacter sediminis]